MLFIKSIRYNLLIVFFFFIFCLLPIKFASANCSWFVNNNCSDIASCGPAKDVIDLPSPEYCNGGINDGEVASIKAKFPGSAKCCCCDDAKTGCCYVAWSNGTQPAYMNLTASACGALGWKSSMQANSFLFRPGYKASNNNSCVKGGCCSCVGNQIIGGDVVDYKVASASDSNTACTAQSTASINCTFHENSTANANQECVDDVATAPIVTLPKSPIESPNSPQSKADVSGPTYIKYPNPIGTTDIAVLIGRFINAFLTIIGSIALIIFVWGAVQWMIAAGNSAKIEAGQKTMMWAALGIAVVFFAYLLVRLVVQAVGATPL